MSVNTLSELVSLMHAKGIVSKEHNNEIACGDIEYNFNCTQYKFQVYHSEKGDWVDVCYFTEDCTGKFEAFVHDEEYGIELTFDNMLIMECVTISKFIDNLK